MICARCGNEFTGRKRKYCTKDCCLRAHGHDPDYKPEPSCLVCGKPLMKGQKKHCSATCNSKAYHRRKGGISMAELKEKRKADPPRNVKDKKRREQLTDGVVKKTLYLMLNRRERGSIKTIQITPKMIAEKRAQLLAWREQRAEIPGPSCKVYFPVCSVCGHIFTAIHKNMGTCSDDCRKEKARQDNYTSNKAKKVLKERLCNECGELFAPEYGDKRRGFCSDVCSHRNLRRRRKQKERARMRNVKVESVSAMAVFERDGWRCQLCHRKLRRADRGTFKDAAPELDHIIPLSKGGEHSYRNTQCACRRCNAEKRGDERGQLRLFG